MTTSSQVSRPESSPAIAEIRNLHGEIVAAAKTTLAHAVRIGELLADIKAGLNHGEWLPWCSTNLPFTDRTARNYVRLFQHRDRLKSETVSDLGDAYRLLADERKPAVEIVQPPPAAWQPLPGRWMMATAPATMGGSWWLDVAPSIHAGFFFVSALFNEFGNGNAGGSIEGSMKAVHAGRVAAFIHRITGSSPDALTWMDDECESPWTYNERLFGSHRDYVDRVILGNGGPR
jgi:hypothetical protein